MEELGTTVDRDADLAIELALARFAAGGEPDVIDESDRLDPEIHLDDPTLLSLSSPSYADVRAEHGTSSVADAARSVSRQTAELWAQVAYVIENADENPEVYLRPDARVSSDEGRDYAVRAAIADLAVQTSLSETAIRTMGEHARRLFSAPELWAAFRAGRVSPANARIAADTLGNLPVEQWSAFGEQVVRAAATLSPARFRRTAHAVRDRLHRVPIAERHAEAAAARRVVLEHDLDGMSWLSLHLPSPVATEVDANIEAHARQLASLPEETRTLDQLRADAAADLLRGASGGSSGSGESGGATRPAPVALTVTVPAGTLLGGDEPGVLAGVGAIPAQTARELAGLGTSFARALTHPETGAVLHLDPDVYRLSESLKRRIRARDRVCTFPGCTRSAASSDVDHIREWQYGGTSEPANLHCLCRHHHRVKSLTRWRPSPPDPESGSVGWTSPTGFAADSDPPPF